MAETYRWNVAEHAAGFDAAAQVIHPYYLEIQQTILDAIGQPKDAAFLLVDLGGGSGRLAERLLEVYPRATALVVDQSAAFLDLAAQRIARFGSRGSCHMSRLQDDWPSALPESPRVLVSMSAIHHLEPTEKQALYKTCYDVLTPGGMFLNGDEVRPADDPAYRTEIERRVSHMQQLVADQVVEGPMVDVLKRWEDRNLTHFGDPRMSGDDCHETIETQLGYLTACGFAIVQVIWRRELWAIMQATKC